MARPKVGDAVNNAAPTWTELPAGTEGINGTITYANKHDDCIMVRYLGGHTEEHTFDEFYGNWTDKFGGLWHLGA